MPAGTYAGQKAATSPALPTHIEGTETVSFCEAIITPGANDHPISPQILDNGCMFNCAPEADPEICGDWSPLVAGDQVPAPTIATSTNTGNKTITTSLPRSFLDPKR